MQLVDSYLTEVSRFLPPAQREDVVGELRATIEEEVAERADAARRQPTDEDEAAVLARHGHPLKVASGYQTRRYLIGPDLYPAFRQTLSTLLVAVLAVQLVIALAVSVGTGWNLSVGGLVSQAVSTIVWVVAIVTLVFVGIEGAGTRLKWYERWEPRSIARGPVSLVNRGDVVTNLITEAIFLLWWNDALSLRGWVPGGTEGSAPLVAAFSDAWTPLFWPLNLIFGAFFLLHAYVLIRGLWQRTTLLAEIALGVAGIAAAGWLLMSDRPLVVTGGVLEQFPGDWLDKTVRWSLAVAAGIAAWDVLKAARVLWGKT